MPRLKNPHKQIPGGFKYRQVETGWDSTKQLHPMPSLRVLAEGVQRHRQGNPHLAKVHGWRMQIDDIITEMDQFNAQLCQDHNWKDFIMTDGAAQGGPAFPKITAPPKPFPMKLGKVAAVGLKSIAEMFGPAGAVQRVVADKRAEVCVGCPQNSQGDWMRFFTVPASEAIRRMMKDATGAGLATAFDEQLHVCEVCACPMKLKVHAQLAHIKKHMDEETFNALPSFCWIKTETA